MRGEQKARELLAGAGFQVVEIKKVEGDIFNTLLCRFEITEVPRVARAWSAPTFSNRVGCR